MAGHKYERRWWKNGHWNYLYPYERTQNATANTSRPIPNNSTTTIGVPSGKGKTLTESPAANPQAENRKQLRAAAETAGRNSGKYYAIGNKVDVTHNPLINSLANNKHTKAFMERMQLRKAVLSNDNSGNLTVDLHAHLNDLRYTKSRQQMPAGGEKDPTKHKQRERTDVGSTGRSGEASVGKNENRTNYRDFMPKRGIENSNMPAVSTDKTTGKLETRTHYTDSRESAKIITDKLIKKLEERASEEHYFESRKAGRDGTGGTFGRPDKYAERR